MVNSRERRKPSAISADRPARKRGLAVVEVGLAPVPVEADSAPTGVVADQRRAQLPLQALGSQQPPVAGAELGVAVRRVAQDPDREPLAGQERPLGHVGDSVLESGQQFQALGDVHLRGGVAGDRSGEQQGRRVDRAPAVEAERHGLRMAAPTSSVIVSQSTPSWAARITSRRARRARSSRIAARL